MVAQRLVGDFWQFALQILQILDCHNRRHRFRINDDERTKPEMLHYFGSEVLRIMLRVFHDKRRLQLLRIALIIRLTRFKNDRDMRLPAFDFAAQGIPRQRIFFPVSGETHVRDNTEDIFAIIRVDIHGLFIRTRQHNFRPPSHAHGLQVVVEGLLRKFLTLFQHDAVKMWEGRRIKTNGVLHQKDDLYADRR